MATTGRSWSCRRLGRPARVRVTVRLRVRARARARARVKIASRTIHRYSPAVSRVAPSAAALATAPAATDSSPRKVCDGNASATWRSIRSCTSASAAVSRSPRDALVFRTSAPSRATTTSAASRPAAIATRTISSSSLAACSHPRTISSGSVADISTDLCEAPRSPLSLPCRTKPTHHRLVSGSMVPPTRWLRSLAPSSASRRAPRGSSHVPTRFRDEYLVNIVSGRRTAQERVTGGRWRRIVQGDVLAEPRESRFPESRRVKSEDKVSSFGRVRHQRLGQRVNIR